MERCQIKKSGIYFFVFLLSISLVSAAIPTTEPCLVKGDVSSTDLDVEELTVNAYKQGKLLMSADVSDGSYEMNSIGANTGDAIDLKVYGHTFQSFTFEGFCKTDGNPWVVENLTVSLQSNGEECSSDAICSSGYCDGRVCTDRPRRGSSGGGIIPPDEDDLLSRALEQVPDEFKDSAKEVLENLRDIIENNNNVHITLQEDIGDVSSKYGHLDISVDDIALAMTTSNAEKRNIKGLDDALKDEIKENLVEYGYDPDYVSSGNVDLVASVNTLLLHDGRQVTIVEYSFRLDAGDHVVEVPKSIAVSAEQISGEFKVLKDDPVLFFEDASEVEFGVATEDMDAVQELESHSKDVSIETLVEREETGETHSEQRTENTEASEQESREAEDKGDKGTGNQLTGHAVKETGDVSLDWGIVLALMGIGCVAILILYLRR